MNLIEGLRPNDAEKLFLTLAYNKFYNIFDEIQIDTFWNNSQYYRYSKIRDVFSIYTELLQYTPIQWALDSLKVTRPPTEYEIGKELFKFVRNVISHFPFYETWDDVWINKTLVNWAKEDQSIDRFLEKNKNTGIIKYRFWEENKKKMTYLSINYPKEYGEDKIYLKNIISEKEGIKFSLYLMRNILDSKIVVE